MAVPAFWASPRSCSNKDYDDDDDNDDDDGQHLVSHGSHGLRVLVAMAEFWAHPRSCNSDRDDNDGDDDEQDLMNREPQRDGSPGGCGSILGQSKVLNDKTNGEEKKEGKEEED